MGYCGGTKQDPTYHDLGDHTETIEIDYDPSKITYAQLLDVFWSAHNPCSAGTSRQYMSAVFCHDESQRRLAEESKAREEKRRGAAVRTAILPYVRFWLAEDYHQKYYLRQDAALMREFAAIYPDWREFTRSTAAARANAYVAGTGSAAQLQDELPGLGLSEAAGRRLRANAGDGEGR